ncbi:MAG: hypothetical protein ACI9LV_000800 [Candidatus Nanohaloarchaea archaeon]|jgi:hypothetical protein
MIEFVCENCGASVEENVLPGKHAVIGTAKLLDRHEECCQNPQYYDSKGFREGTVKQALRDMVPSLSA